MTTNICTASGTVRAIIDHGTIVTILLMEPGHSEGSDFVINFDHRPFQNLIEAEGGGIVGRTIRQYRTPAGNYFVAFDEESDTAPVDG